MDKLRALSYFAAAAQEASFSAAARRFEVSVPAVAKLVTALEASLGTSLFVRSARGLKLTSDGENYLAACVPLLDQLRAADEVVRQDAARPRGTVVLGAAPHVAQACIFPALPQFHAQYRDIQIDIRIIHRMEDVEPNSIDLYVLAGWPVRADMVQRRIGLSRFMVCASPAYWALHGVPQHPQDLRQHTCLLFRNPGGTLLDVWRAERGAEREEVAVSGWLVSNHRDVLLDAALAGEGVSRFSDITIWPHLQSGRLVPVLLDWDMKDAPPVNLLYRPGNRRVPRVRLLIDFLVAHLRELEALRDSRDNASQSAPRPYWYHRKLGRISAAAQQRV
jgi:LysR family transcriptional regulator, regulator for bpeEF and oprC